MKRDEVAETARSLVSYVEEHARTLALAAVALIVAVVVFAGLQAWRSGKAKKGNELLARALTVVAAPIDVENPDPDNDAAPSFADAASRRERAIAAFEEVLDGHGGGLAAVAAAHLGDLSAEAGEIQAAAEYWRQVAEEAPDTLVGQRARVNLLELRRVQGEGEAVAEELRSELADPQTSLPTDVTLYELARSLEMAGKSDEARGVYQQIVDEHQESGYASEARQRLEQL